MPLCARMPTMEHGGHFIPGSRTTRLASVQHPMNDLDRDRFYGPGGDEWGDDGEDYELEPVDAEVLAAEQRRARDLVEEAELAIDVDEIFRVRDRHPDHDLPGQHSGRFRFRFQVKHLLVAMAVMSVVMTLWHLGILVAVLVVLLVAGVVGTFTYMEVKQQRQWVEANRRWEEKFERRRAFLERRMRPPTRSADALPSIYDDYPFGDAAPVATPEFLRRGPNETNRARQRFRFQFSLWQMLVAMTVVCVVLGLTYIVGSPVLTAALLAIVILGGLAARALGVEPPETVRLSWWLLIALYVVASLAAVVVTAF